MDTHAPLIMTCLTLKKIIIDIYQFIFMYKTIWFNNLLIKSAEMNDYLSQIMLLILAS